jgi:ABC-type branched-subunit amino acid transport system substrate-binding protein
VALHFRLQPAANPENLRLSEPPTAYAAVQAWAQAVEEAGTLEASDVSEVLHSAAFDTVLGSIGFNAKGDVTGIDSFDWYIWQGGSYVPLNDADPTD